MLQILGNDTLNKAQLYVSSLPPFRSEYLQFEFSGTNQAAMQLLLADLGTLQIKTSYFGQFVNIPFTDLAVLNNIFGGSIRNSSLAGGAFNITLVVPFTVLDRLYQGARKNCLKVDPDWKMEIYVQNLNFSKVLSGVLTISTQSSTAPQLYVPYLDYVDHTVSTAQYHVFPIEKQNLAKMILYRNTAVLGQVSEEIDGKQYVNSDFAKIESETNYEYALETFINDYAVINFNPTNELYERISKTLTSKISITTGGVYRMIFNGTIENDLTNDMRNATLASVADKVITKARRFRDDRGIVRNLASSINRKTAALRADAEI